MSNLITHLTKSVFPSYEQFKFQVKGYRKTYDDEAIKAGIVGSVTDNMRDYLDFVGFDKELPVLMEALEMRYGKGLDVPHLDLVDIGQNVSTTDRLMGS